MGKNKGAKSRGTKESVEELMSHTPLQAILLADSFTTEFRPITLDRPKALLPVVNVAMIDHTLFWLQSAGVKEVFVFCCNHADQVIQHLQDSGWFAQPNFSVTKFRSNNAAGAGDALRFIYEQDVVRGDFVLVSGDTVSNIPLEKVMGKHRERRKKDRNAILTMVVKKSKPSNDEQFMRIDPVSKQLIYYNKKAENQDSFIDICSPEVLSMFADNFDYQHLRRHFLKSLLDDDAMGYKVYTHEIRSSYYAARVDSFGSYGTVSKDIIQRMPKDDLRFFENSCSAKIGQFTVIGSGTTVGNNSEISNSVVGDGCKIGENVSIDGSFIWNNVTIEDGCVLKNAVVCDGVIMRSGAMLETGAVLSFKVVVGQGFVVPAYSKVSLYQQLIKQEDSDDSSIIMSTISDSATAQAASEVGHGGMGFLWLNNDEGTSGDDDNDDYEEEEDEEDEEEEDDDDDVIDENQNFDDEYDDTKQYFDGEVLATFERYESENHEDNNVILEVNSLRLSCNLVTADCAGAVFYSIMKLALARDHTSSTELTSNAKSLLTKWKKVLAKYLPTMDEEIEVIMKFEELCESEKEYDDAQLIFSILDHLYDEGIIQEEAVMKWESEQEGADESEKVFLKKAETFINWLKLAQEEE